MIGFVIPGFPTFQPPSKVRKIISSIFLPRCGEFAASISKLLYSNRIGLSIAQATISLISGKLRIYFTSDVVISALPPLFMCNGRQCGSAASPPECIIYPPPIFKSDAETGEIEHPPIYEIQFKYDRTGAPLIFLFRATSPYAPQISLSPPNR